MIFFLKPGSSRYPGGAFLALASILLAGRVDRLPHARRRRTAASCWRVCGSHMLMIGRNAWTDWYHWIGWPSTLQARVLGETARIDGDFGRSPPTWPGAVRSGW